MMYISTDDSSKRVVPEGENEERDGKKQKADDESDPMQVSHMERMMREDVCWKVDDFSDTCEVTPEGAQHASTVMNFYAGTTGELFHQRLVRRAVEALHRFNKIGVNDHVDQKTNPATDKEGIFGKVRWVRVNRG